MQKRQHITEVAAEVEKARYGISLVAFRDFMIFGNKAISLKAFGLPFNMMSASQGMLVGLRKFLA